MNVNTLALCVVVLASCARASEAPVAPPSPGANPARQARPGKVVPGGAEALAAVDQNLARLRALEVFEVGALIVASPTDGPVCYAGQPCPGREESWERARQKAALRLATFAKQAEATAAQTTAVAAPDEAEKRVDANLAALAALNIVGVKGLVRVTPANNPSCYGHPCEKDIVTAKATNALRAGKLDAIVRSAAAPGK